MLGSVAAIETFGTVDGPGIRTVVFLNGCKLRCLYCHNPEMWHSMSKTVKPEDLAKRIIRNKNYFGETGGVTFSGGEPLLQSEFLIEVCKILKKENIHIALDTAGCGLGNYEEILQYIDLIIFDVKHTDIKGYKDLTGTSIDESLNFLKTAVKLNKKFWIRQVVVPGIMDNEDYLNSLKDFIKDIPNIEKIEFLPYHKLGMEKYEKLGLNNSLKDVPEMDKKTCQELYEKFIKDYMKLYNPLDR